MDSTKESPAGLTGYVTVAIPGPGRPGEVRVSIRGGSESFIAYAEAPVERGATVIVVGDRGARCVDVVAG